RERKQSALSPLSVGDGGWVALPIECLTHRSSAPEAGSGEVFGPKRRRFQPLGANSKKTATSLPGEGPGIFLHFSAPSIPWSGSTSHESNLRLTDFAGWSLDPTRPGS